METRQFLDCYKFVSNFVLYYCIFHGFFLYSISDWFIQEWARGISKLYRHFKNIWWKWKVKNKPICKLVCSLTNRELSSVVKRECKQLLVSRKRTSNSSSGLVPSTAICTPLNFEQIGQNIKQTKPFFSRRHFSQHATHKTMERQEQRL
jgi:hypothetical protein